VFHVLVIEDDPVAARAIETMLGASTGEVFSPTCAAALADGICMAGKKRFDAVLLDLDLPDSRGLQTLDTLVAQAPHLPIVVVTGTDDKRTSVAALARGAQAYLVKSSLDANLLSHTIASAVRQKEASEALRTSEERFRLLFHKAPIGIALADAGCRFIDANDAFCRMLGYSREEMKAMDLRTIVHPDDRVQVDAMARKIVTGTERGFTAERRYIRKDGSAIWANLTTGVITASDGSFLFGIGMVEDITERRCAETALRKSELRMNSIFKSVDDAILVVAPDRTLLDVNDAGEKMFGYSKSELAGRSTEILHVDHEHYLAFGEMIWEAFERGESARFGFTARRKNGEVFPTEHTVSLLRDRAQKDIGIVSVVRDITERKRAEEKIRAFSRELIAAREGERKRVSSALHHDVGSLVVGMSAYFDAVEHDIRSGKPKEALRSAKAVRKLFNESVVRLKNLAVELRPPDLDILGLHAAMRQYFSRTTEQTGVRIRFTENMGRRRLADDAAIVLFRVVQETLTNAVTHGRATKVDVQLRLSKKIVSLTIRDNGAGFDPSRHPARATSHMGLRMMQETVIPAGGAFEVDPGPGKGTTVKMTLPLGGQRE